MSKIIRLKKGFDINLAGKAEKTISSDVHPETFAIKPLDFPSLERPKLLVNEGDAVKAGTLLFYDKKKPYIKVSAPVSGEVVEIIRGEKRRLEEIRILPDKDYQYEAFKAHSPSDINNLDAEEAKKQIIEAGMWVNIIQRPFGIIANPEDEPKGIYVSGFDSHPLAANTGLTLKGEERYFQAGVDVLNKLCSGNVNLGLNADEEVPSVFAQTKNVNVYKFSGPHPSGNVGIQIHHIEPINKGDVVWTLKPVAVIWLGKLFLEGKCDLKQIIALAGSEVKNPQYYESCVGASVAGYIKDNLNSEHVRIISGNALTGERIKEDGYLGYYDNMLTVLPEGDRYKFFLTEGWFSPQINRLSAHRALLLFSFLNGKKKEYKLDTNMNGEERAFVQTGMFEKVVPMDIYPVYLLKAIMAEDYDEMEALGIFEVIEEDLALCEFVDVSKMNVQKIVRDGINLMLEA
jgi:Na+-transporting NADH:ubiquinone oxidoreductase subunit A